jgi:hypothetical protein
MMGPRRPDGRRLSRHFLTACVLLGFYLDVLPTPTPGIATPDKARPVAGSPLTPRPDDSERDETPDEAGDLAWPEVTLVARGGNARGRGHLTRPFAPDPAAFARAHFGTDQLSRRRAAPFAGLPVLLCRLTC